MSVRINQLSIGLTIGSHKLLLKTDTLPTAEDIKTGVIDYAKQLQDMMLNLSFKMEEGKIITVAIEDFLNMVAEKIGQAGLQSVQEFFNKIAGATTGLYIDLWGVSFTTLKIPKDPNAKPKRDKDTGRLNFAFNVRVRLTDKFYKSINVPEEVTNIITLDSLGLGIRFDKEFALPVQS